MEMTIRERSLLEANGQRFKEYLAGIYPSLKQYKPLTSKNEIANYIPLDYVNRLLWHYKLFDEICKKPSGLRKYPNTEITDIKRILRELKRKNWLQGSDDSEIASLILDKFMKSPEGINHKKAKTKIDAINRHGGQWPDYALHFIIYFLVEYLKEATGKPNYERVAVLINEQTNHTFTFLEIQKKYDRIRRNHNKLWTLFNILRYAYFKDYFDKLFSYKDFQPELNADFVKYCLPEFIDFYPPKKKQFLIGNQTQPA
ncbi:MAG: hypothetical protein ACLQBQ_03635 [Smithella sp.]